MFEKFGEMGSWEELNTLAKNLWNEGDKDGLRTMCKENGLDYQDMEDAAEDGIELFVTPTMAAMGRLKIEEKETKIPKEAAGIIFGMARAMASDPKTAPMFLARGKRLDGVWKKLEDIARKNKSGNSGVACGTDRDLQKLIRENYGR